MQKEIIDKYGHKIMVSHYNDSIILKHFIGGQVVVISTDHDTFNKINNAVNEVQK